MPRALQISHPTAQALSPAQKRFNALLKRIESARARVAAWQQNLPLSLNAHAEVVVPLAEKLTSHQHDWAFLLGRQLDRPKGWTKAERETLTELLCDIAGMLLDEQETPDPELKALYDRYADVDFDTEREHDLHAMKEMAAALTGMDLGDEAVSSREELMQRMEAAARQAAADQADNAASAAPSRRRGGAAQARREARAEAEAQAVTQSLREIYRKLASALHPDRETDPLQREAKNALMQRANQAYAANDLLTLLELQLQTEQIDADHMGRASATQLKHYNRVLAEQLEELQAEEVRLEMEFRYQVGADPGVGLNPSRLGRVVDENAAALRAELAQLQRWVRALDSPATAKPSLKQMRQNLRDEEREDAIEVIQSLFAP